MTLDNSLYKAKRELQGFVLQPYQESLWILSEVLNLSPSEIYLRKKDLKENQEKVFFKKILRRKQGEPLEYILKEKIFFKKQFYVEPGVFIPREDTEILAQWILQNIKEQQTKAIDFGAGVGTLCLTLLSLLPDSEFVALEINRSAVKCLKQNSKNFQVKQRLHILQKDVCQIQKREVIQVLGSPPSLIVANPPYIDSQDNSIDSRVYFFEPPQALFSDKEGMGHIYSWFEKAVDFLRPGGLYIFEFGWNQLDKIEKFLGSQIVLESYKIYRDKSDHPRMAVCLKK